MKKLTHLHLGWPEDEYIFSIFSFLPVLFFIDIIHTHFADAKLTDVLPHFMRGGERAVSLHHGTLLTVSRCFSLKIHTFILNSKS